MAVHASRSTNKPMAHTTSSVETMSTDMCNFGSLHKTPPHVMYITGKLKPKDITQNTTARLRKRLVLYPPPPSSSPSHPVKERTRKTKPPIDAIMVITRPVQVMAP